MFGTFPYFLYAKSILSLASNAKTVDDLFADNIFALFPIPVPASSMEFCDFKNVLNCEIDFQPNLSRNQFLCQSIQYFA